MRWRSQKRRNEGLRGSAPPVRRWLEPGGAGELAGSQLDAGMQIQHDVGTADAAMSADSRGRAAAAVPCCLAEHRTALSLHPLPAAHTGRSCLPGVGVRRCASVSAGAAGAAGCRPCASALGGAAGSVCLLRLFLAAPLAAALQSGSMDAAWEGLPLSPVPLSQVGAAALPSDVNRAHSKKLAGPLVLQVR